MTHQLGHEVCRPDWDEVAPGIAGSVGLHVSVPDRTVIKQFIASFIRDDIHLVAIRPDGPGACGRHFGNNVAAAVDWAASKNATGFGVYWTVNVVRPEVHKKCSKADITEVRFLHVDIDPPFDRAALLARLGDAPEPSIIVDSGAGIHAYWRLPETCADQARAEDLNRALADRFGGDRCHNIDRVMRLPGTINHPSAPKRQKGRTPVLSTVIEARDVQEQSLDALCYAFGIPVTKDRTEAGHTASSAFDPAKWRISKRSRVYGLILRGGGTGDRSSETFGVACELVRRGATDAEISNILLDGRLAISEHCRGQRDPKRAADRAIAAARIKCGQLEPRNTGPRQEAVLPEPTTRLQVHVERGDLHGTVKAAESVLIERQAEIYVKAGTLVRPVVEDELVGSGRTTKIARLVGVKDDYLLGCLSKHAQFLTYDRRADEWRPSDPPLQVAKTLLSWEGHWRLPQVAAVLTTPTMLMDGTILSSAGYDSSTRLLLMQPPPMPVMPDAPSRDDALASLARLNLLLREFPFRHDVSRSVALSALMTPVLRGALPVAPAHAVTSPAPGSGKSYLVDLCATLASGERAPVISMSERADEFSKRLDAVMISGQQLVSIDNIDGAIGGDTLCQMIERPSVQVRVLGSSELRRTDSRTSVYMTGNNLALVDDLVRRVLVCELDPKLERPELRKFCSDPRSTLLDSRGSYLADVLTIARAYVVAGRPGKLIPLASFEAWSDTVRSALVWLGCADPVSSMERARAQDPVLSLLRPLMQAWSELGGQKPHRVSEIIALAEGQSDAHKALAGALDTVCGEKSGHNAKKLGQLLMRHADRIVDGLKIVGAEDAHLKQRVWRVVKADAG